MFLERIKNVNDIKQFNEEELEELSAEIRDFFIFHVSASPQKVTLSTKVTSHRY